MRFLFAIIAFLSVALSVIFSIGAASSNNAMQGILAALFSINVTLCLIGIKICTEKDSLETSISGPERIEPTLEDGE